MSNGQNPVSNGRLSWPEESGPPRVSAVFCALMTTNKSLLPAPPSQAHWIYWVCQLGGWGAYTLMEIPAVVTDMQVTWANATVTIVLLNVAGLGLTHWLRSVMQRRRWSTLGLRMLALRCLTASFVLGIPLGVVSSFTSVATSHYPAPYLESLPAPFGLNLSFALTMSLNVVNWAFLFLLWLVIYFTTIGIRQRKDAALRQSELARALQQAELRLLKSQLNPHFLFNALNTVRSLIADEPSKAQHAVTRLANTLRYTLGAGHNDLVSLSRELEIVADYLEIEKMRFEDRLTIEREIAADSGDAQIPVMLLQTVVENAIKHGIAELPAGGVLRISAALEGSVLVLNVENPRPLASSPLTREGTGLRNAEERLRLLFNAGASLELDLSQPARATTRIRIPQHP
jgi:two-component system sensor histidine kinase AlgZ